MTTLDELGTAEMDAILDFKSTCKSFKESTAYIVAIGSPEKDGLLGMTMSYSQSARTLLDLFGMLLKAEDQLPIAALSGIEDVLANPQKGVELKNKLIQIMDIISSRYKEDYYG